jgi:hypothetical protein
MKFTRPLYRMLATSKIGNKLAYELFYSNSNIYHPICRKMVKSDLDKLAVAAKAKSGSGSGNGNTFGPIKMTHSFFVGIAASTAFFLLGKLRS